MGNKDLLKVETSWFFPLIKYITNTSYIEVGKASGIAYILIELIANSANKDEKIVATLKNFGIPLDIHDIFIDALIRMIHFKIFKIKSGEEFSRDYVDTYTISNFEFTDLGKKMLAEGNIPIGEDEKIIDVYYDLAKKDTRSDFNYYLCQIKNTTIDETCIGNITLDNADIEEYIKNNMSLYEFKKEERITVFKHKEAEILAYDVNNAISIRIDDEKMYLVAKDKDRDNFIKKNYSLDIISKMIMAKKRYSFSKDIISKIKNYEYSKIQNIVQINFPSEFNNVINKPNQLSFSSTETMTESECSISQTEALEIFQKCGIESQICFFNKNNLYSIIPGNFSIEVEGYSGKCNINLILIQQLSEEIKNLVLREICLQCIDVEEWNTKVDIIKKITEISKCKDYIDQFVENALRKQKSLYQQIDTFFKLNEQFIKIKEWKSIQSIFVERLFEALCNEITLNNVKDQDECGQKLNKILNLSPLNYLKRISQKIKENNIDDVTAYEKLEELDYNIDIVLTLFNAFTIYCQKILDGKSITGKSKLGSWFTLFGKSISELRKLTGIINPEDLCKLDINNDEFLKVMENASENFRKIKNYKHHAVEQFQYFELLMQRYIDIKEVIMIEKEASKNPQNIDKKYIEQLISKSKYKDAICDLHVRLEYELNKILETKNISTFDLLKDKKISLYLTEEESNKMHSLRICRNEFQHPKEKREVQYSEKIIQTWCNVVESIVEKLKDTIHFKKIIPELQKITGITYPLKDLPKLDDNDKFLKTMENASGIFTRLKTYKYPENVQFQQFEELMQRYTDIQEVIMIEKEASKNPQKIDKKYIEQLITQSKYKDAICNLHVRLEYELNKILETKNRSTFDLLKDKKISLYLTKEEINKMHSLITCRNEFQHPRGKRTIQYSKSIIQTWSNIVEKLGNIKNEINDQKNETNDQKKKKNNEMNDQKNETSNKKKKKNNEINDQKNETSNKKKKKNKKKK